ncbi:MAG: glycosyltransferase [Bacteroidota bacterium]
MRIIICPLDWGWGHATRIIPIIRKCVEQEHEVWIGSSGSSGKLLKEEFPNLKHIHIPNYRVRYSRYNSQIIAILIQLPLLFISLIWEHFLIKHFVKKHRFEMIISDNRYTIRSTKAYNVFITHQLKVMFPRPVKVFGEIFHFIQHKLIKKFDEVWLPDEKSNLNISGALSDTEKNQKKIYEIGLLSRFTKISPEATENKKYDLLIILSGPEPQRNILEKKLFQQLENSNLNILLIRGTFQPLKIKPSSFEICSYMDTKTMEQTIRSSDLILCRSGYSSIMDLIRLRKQAILVPTPGQTEQEYLARWLTKRKYFYSVNQNDIQIQKDIRSALTYYPPKESYSQNLEKRLNILN